MRYPLQALLDAAGISMTALRELFPMSGQTYRTARTQGLTEQQADRYACTLGLVPWLVWSDWLDDAHVECASCTCSVTFVPRRKSHRFCSDRCRDREYAREWARTRYQSDPEWREKQKARVTAARQGNRRAETIAARERRRRRGEAARDYDRAYYLANRERILAKKREYDRARRAKTNGNNVQQDVDSDRAKITAPTLDMHPETDASSTATPQGLCGQVAA